MMLSLLFFFFFFNDTATTEIYTLSLHDALPIYGPSLSPEPVRAKRSSPLLDDRECIISGSPFHFNQNFRRPAPRCGSGDRWTRSEEHTSELQSLAYLVCRLLLEKKKNIKIYD